MRKKKTLTECLELSFLVGCPDREILCPNGFGSRILSSDVFGRLANRSSRESISPCDYGWDILVSE
jgi:hypothetical protein